MGYLGGEHEATRQLSSASRHCIITATFALAALLTALVSDSVVGAHPQQKPKLCDMAHCAPIWKGSVAFCSRQIHKVKLRALHVTKCAIIQLTG